MFIKANLFSVKYLGIVYLFLVTSISGYCQTDNPRVDIVKIYKSEIERLLLPNNNLGTKTYLIAAFLAHPPVEPDYSICMKDSAHKFYLEFRILEKNLWIELLTGFIQKRSQSVSLKPCLYSASVSKHFKMKMLKAFDHIRYSPVKKDPLLVEQYDGITYKFMWVKNSKKKKIIISNNLNAESYESALVKLLSLISSDLKNNSFKESKYIDKLK